MHRNLWILTIIILAGAIWLFAGGFTSFAQFNTQKIAGDVANIVDEAQEKTISNIGQVGARPEDGGTGEEPISLEDIPEDKLREAIAAVSEFAVIAGSASNRVHAYISKIKIKQRVGDMKFEPGEEPWKSEKSEIRYSPFDPISRGSAPVVDIQMQQPFLPPLGEVVGPLGIEILGPLFKLQMTMKVGDEFIALGEFAGIPIEMKVGESLKLPDGMPSELPELIVSDISIEGVLLRSGSQTLSIPFAGPTQSTEERPFDIRITK